MAYLSKVELSEHTRPRHVRALSAQLLEQVVRQSLAGLEMLGELHRESNERGRGIKDTGQRWTVLAASIFLRHTSNVGCVALEL